MEVAQPNPAFALAGHDADAHAVAEGVLVWQATQASARGHRVMPAAPR